MDAAKPKKTARLDGIISVEPLAEFTHMGFNFFVYSDNQYNYVVEETTGLAVLWTVEKNTMGIVNHAKIILNSIGVDEIKKEIQKHAKI